MADRVRHHYRLELRREPVPEPPGGVILRTPNHDDQAALARLMLDAYRGTIDYDGEGPDEADAEVAGFLAGGALLDVSVLAFADQELVAACLVALHEGRAMVGYVMTATDHKGRGLGGLVTAAALAHLRRAGYETVDAWITEGNTPSERIFAGLGFRMLA